MAEGFFRELNKGRGESYSAGSAPSGFVHPLAIAVMKEAGARQGSASPSRAVASPDASAAEAPAARTHFDRYWVYCWKTETSQKLLVEGKAKNSTSYDESEKTF